MCPWCNGWLSNAHSALSKTQIEKGLEAAICNKCGKLSFYNPQSREPKGPTPPRERVFVLED